MAQSETEILVEKIPQKVAHAIVRPSPMHKQEPFQVFKLGYRVVRGQDGLHPFLA